MKRLGGGGGGGGRGFMGADATGRGGIGRVESESECVNPGLIKNVSAISLSDSNNFLTEPWLVFAHLISLFNLVVFPTDFHILIGSDERFRPHPPF